MDDTAAQAMATRAIDYFGSSSTVDFRRETNVIDPVTGAPTPTVETESPACVFVGIGDRVSQSENFQVTDEVLIAPSLTMTPDSNVTITRGSDTYKVIGSLPKKPGSVVHYHELVVRKIR